MRFIPGPDLPTGGKIVGLDGIKEAYETGRGTFRMRATARVETLGRRKGIVVTELPYGVGTEKVVERIKTLVQGKKLQGISDIKDLTDRAKGLRLVIEVKNGFVPEALLEQLYRQTPMEDTFGINAVALVDGQPRTLGLKELLRVFLDHRFEVVRRRSVFRRGKAADRLHLVQGLLIAIIDIDEVIQLIRTSDNTAMAKERLIQVFDLTEVQADYILEMPLRRLTRFSRIELEKEQSELEATIEGLDAIIGDEQLRWNVVSDELAEVAKTYGTPRRTVLLESAGTTVTATAAPLEVTDDPCFAFLSSSGLLARSSSDEVPGSGDGRANHDVVVSVGAYDGQGRGRRADHPRPRAEDRRARPAGAAAVRQRPEPAGRRCPSPRCCRWSPGERALALTSLRTDGPGLAIGTRQGVVKRVNPEVLTNRDEWEVIGLKDGDEVVGATDLATGTETLCFITSDAQLLHFTADGVRPQGRAGGGMAGVRLSTGERVAWFGALDPADAVVVTASGSSTALPGTEPGALKVTPFSEYPAKGRATGGVRCHRFLKGEDTLVLAWAGAAPARAAAASGAPVDLPEATGKRDGSGVPGIAADRGRRRTRRFRRGGPHGCDRVTTVPTRRWTRRTRRWRSSPLALAACSGDDDSGPKADEQTPEEVLAAAQQKLTETSGVQLSMTTDDLPEGINAIQKAVGVATDAPAFEGDLTVTFERPGVRRAGDRGRRPGLRRDPPLARLAGRRPGGLRRAGPGRLPLPRRRLRRDARERHRSGEGRQRPRRREQRRDPHHLLRHRPR